MNERFEKIAKDAFKDELEKIAGESIKYYDSIIKRPHGLFSWGRVPFILGSASKHIVERSVNAIKESYKSIPKIINSKNDFLRTIPAIGTTGIAGLSAYELIKNSHYINKTADEKNGSNFIKDNPVKSSIGIGAAIAGLSYAAMRRPSKSSMIYKAFGKHLKPSIVRQGWGHKYHPGIKGEPEGILEKIIWSPWKKHEADFSPLKKFKKETPESEKMVDKIMKATASKADPKKEVFMGLEASDYTTNPKFKKGMKTGILQGDVLAKNILDKYKHQTALAKTKYGIKTELIKNPKKIKNLNEDQIKSHLSNGGDDWILKPKSDFMHHLGTSGGTVMTKKTRGKEWDLVKRHPRQYIKQEKIKNFDPNKNEFRATVAGNKVLSIVPRYSYGNEWVFPKSKLMNRQMYQDFEKIVKAHHKALNIKDKDLFTAGMDISRTYDPKTKKPIYKIIESNVGVSGGDLDAPIQNSRMYKALTGKEPIHTAIAKSTAIGTVAAGASYAAIPKKDKQ